MTDDSRLSVPLNAPYSQEAEEAVIGSILVNPNAYVALAAFLEADDFYLLRHQFIWQAIARLNERNEALDYLTIVTELKNMGWLEDIGGPAYITRLVNNTPHAIHAEFYGRIVERAAVRRRLLKATDEIKALAVDEQIDLDRVVNEAESRLFDVTDRQVKREFKSMYEAVGQYFDQIEYLMQNRDKSFGVPTGFKDLDQLLGGFQRSDLVIFAGRPGMGKCVAAGTRIPTERGLVPIESLKPQDVTGTPDDEGGLYYPLRVGVMTPTGRQYTAYFYDSGLQPTRRMTTKAGYSLTATYPHPVLTLTPDGQKAWKSMADLRVGDYVAVQRHAPIWGTSRDLPAFSYKYNDNLRSTKVPSLPAKIDDELAYILGILVGDGNLTQDNAVRLASADEEIVSTFYAFAQRLNLHARFGGKYDHAITSKVLVNWLANLGVSGYAYEKVVPSVISKSPERIVRAFIQGLFDTDGHAEIQNGYLQYITVSEQLAKEVHQLLLLFNIVSRLSFKPNTHRGSWAIRITGENARKFYDNIGFRLERKQSRMSLVPTDSNANLDVIPYLPKTQARFGKHKNYGRYFRGDRKPSYGQLREISKYASEVVDLLEPEYYWDSITALEDAGIQQCYDLSVPEGHAFVANGIVSHNTAFLLSAAANAARIGARVAIFSMEMGSDQIVQRLISMETGISTQKLRLAQLTPQEYMRFVEAAGRVSRMPIFIDDTPALSPLQMRTKCRRLQHEHGLDMIMVDYLQLMNAGGQYQNNRVQEISYISRALKELARELNVPLISAAQLSRAVEQRQDKRPVLSDLRESGCIAGDETVYLPDEGRHVPIRDLSGKSGFRVLSLNERTWKLEAAQVTNAFCTGIKPVYRMTTRLGRTIRATGNHKFLTICGWKRLDELTSDDHIALPRTLPTPETQTMSNAELALLGHLIGDGCTLPNHAVQYTTRELDLAETVAKLARDVFGDAIKPRIHQEKGHSWYQVFLAATAKLTHNKHSPVRVWLESLGVWGLRSHEKRIPEKVFQQPRAAIALFLRHLWATDGSINVKPVTNGYYPAIYYASSSYILAQGVQTLLLTLGINARLKAVPQGTKGRTQYHVILGGKTELQNFADTIGAVGQYKSDSLTVIKEKLDSTKENTNRDVIPHHAWTLYAKPAMATASITGREMYIRLNTAYAGTAIYKQNVSRERAAKLADAVHSEEIRNLSTSDVYWDEIVSIEPDGETDVYDLTVDDHHNFSCCNIICHNSIEQDSDVVMFLYRDVVYNEATEYPNQADVIVGKHRNGPTGSIQLFYDGKLTKFMDGVVRRVDLGDT